MARKQPTYLVPFCARTGSLLHYVYALDVPTAPGRAVARVNYQEREVDWRLPVPFVPAGPVIALEAQRGRSAAYLLLAGPVLAVEPAWPDAPKDQTVEVRATYPVGLAGILGFIRGGAFDERGVLRAGLKLRPVKRGDNYLAELHREPEAKS